MTEAPRAMRTAEQTHLCFVQREETQRPPSWPLACSTAEESSVLEEEGHGAGSPWCV